MRMGAGVAVVLLLATLLALPPSAAASRTAAWTFANYELSDVMVAFVAWTPARPRLPER